MLSQDQCRNELLGAFDDACQGKTVSAGAREWLTDFCNGWLPDPPNANGRSVMEIWDDGGPPTNGQNFLGRFRKIGALAIAKSHAAKKDEITETEVEAATNDVIASSMCTFCPDE